MQYLALLNSSVQGGDEEWYTSDEEEEIKRNDPFSYPEYRTGDWLNNASVRIPASGSLGMKRFSLELYFRCEKTPPVKKMMLV